MEDPGVAEGQQVELHLSASQNSEPFHISTKVAFEWGAVNAARAATCEEDLLTELLGRKQKYPKTQPRWTRVDIALYATLPYGSTAPMPDAQMFGPWTSSVGEKLDKLLAESRKREGRIVAVTGGGNEVVAEACSSPGGMLFLRGVPVSGFRLIRIPRVWDDPVRRSAEKDIDEELTQFSGRFGAVIDEWARSIVDRDEVSGRGTYFLPALPRRATIPGVRFLGPHGRISIQASAG